MKHICCVLDACVIINLIHISEDEFILRKMDKLDIHINSMVFTEVRNNVYDRLPTILLTKLEKKAATNLLRKTIDQKLTFFRSKMNDNEALLKDLGSEYFDRIKEITEYKKKLNGELCSTAQALYISRFCEKKVFFYTDDYPAKKDFSSFFNYQQIGQIKDSIDLLILLFWLDEHFTAKQLDNTLSELHSQYATSVVLLKGLLTKFHSEKVDATFMRTKKPIVEKLRMLLKKLKDLDFSKLSEFWEFFHQHKGKCPEIVSILKIYNCILELETSSGYESILEKITSTRNLITKNKVYKWKDLISK